MRFGLPLIILIITAGLVALGVFAPSHLGATVGVKAGSAVPGVVADAASPQQAIDQLLTEVRKRNWHAAYSQLASSNTLTEGAFTGDVAGSNGSLRTLSVLEGWDLSPLHQGGNDAEVRTAMRWTSAVGPIVDVRDLHVVRQDNTWKVVWPAAATPNLPAQVVPSNYLRWDLVTPTAADEWGSRNIDAPHVRILSMNAVDHNGGSVVMGEVVNEDTIPAFVNVNATLVGNDGNPLSEENSFDKISHTLLPKQVSPYRIDFPNVPLQSVKNVRMDVKAALVPASADPVIGVMNQKLDKDPLGKRVLRGDLLSQSGQVVDIPHVIATFYDNSGKVIWVSDGYVAQPLFPQTPVPFAVEIPEKLASEVQSYHVVVNQYSPDKL